MTCLLTATGATVNLQHIEPASISLLDIAHHLAQINRYTGACSRPYSVAEHSLLVVQIMEQRGITDSSTLLAGLMHDAHEAYVSDISQPLKQVLGDYWRLQELRVQHIVLARFKLREAYIQATEQIHHADMTALSTERAALMPPAGPMWPCSATHPPVPHDFSSDEALTWKCWRQAFVEKFAELNERRRAVAEATHQAHPLDPIHPNEAR